MKRISNHEIVENALKKLRTHTPATLRLHPKRPRSLETPPSQTTLLEDGEVLKKPRTVKDEQHSICEQATDTDIEVSEFERGLLEGFDEAFKLLPEALAEAVRETREACTREATEDAEEWKKRERMRSSTYLVPYMYDPLRASFECSL